FGYYWAPTPILGRYDMVKVDFQSGIDEKHYKSCITKPECPNPRVSMFPSSPVVTVTTEKFAQKASEAYLYLARRSFKNDQMNKILKWIDENQADGETAAIYFLNNNQNIWLHWIPADIAAKIKQVLENL
ncbi:MAG: glycine betaine ABC transporter substrate-binding protein, partial [Desulfobulbia bacterium]